MQPQSAIQAHSKEAHIKNKSQLMKTLELINPSFRKLRILTDEDDTRSQNHNVAIFEQTKDGKLKFLVGAPTLSMAASFFANAIDDGRIE